MSGDVPHLVEMPSFFLKDWEERYEDLTYFMWTTSFLGSSTFSTRHVWEVKREDLSNYLCYQALDPSCQSFKSAIPAFASKIALFSVLN